MVNWADPAELFTHTRLDLIDRLHYALNYRNQWSQFAANDYLAFMKILGAGQKIEERGSLHSAKDRLQAFDALLYSLEEFGFESDLSTSPIIVSNNGVLLNGAHRVAAAYALNIPKIPIERFSGILPPLGTTYEGLLRAGFTKKKLEALLLESMRISKRARFMLLFSESEKYSIPLSEQVGKVGEIIYQSSFHLTAYGIKKLIELAYMMTGWWQQTYIDDIVHSKTKGEKAPYSAHLVVYSPYDLDLDVRELKLSVREHLESLGMDGRQLHGSDAWHDTRPVLEILLVEGGRFFLNGVPYGSDRALMQRLEGERSAAGLEPTQVVLAGSVVLELHGLRAARDIDYFSLVPPSKDKHDWGCRNFNPEYTSQILWDVCSSGESFVYKGFRFQSLEMYLRCQDLKRLTKKGNSDFQLAYALFDENKKFLDFKLESLIIVTRRVKFAGRVFLVRIYGKVAQSVPVPMRRAIKWLIGASKLF